MVPVNEKTTAINNAISLTDGPFADDLFPFSQTRSVADIPCGILSIREKWAYDFPAGNPLPPGLTIPANLLPGRELVLALQGSDQVRLDAAIRHSPRLQCPLDIIRYNDQEMRNDFERITRGRLSQPVPESNRVILPGADQPHAEKETGPRIFIEPGARLEHCVLNVAEGPIYIGKNALLMEGCLIRGPFALGDHSVMKMGSRVYPATAIGSFCSVGGEIKNSVIFNYSNKAHEGYLGDSVIGAWCNLGAGTSNSNLKNSAGPIKYWNPLKNRWMDGGPKCGLFMGDYSRSAINSAFNTGAVVGVCAHVFGRGLTPAYLSSFSWGYDPVAVYDFDKAIQHIRQWMALKNKTLPEAEINQLKSIFDQQKNLS